MNDIVFNLDKPKDKKNAMPRCWICNDQGMVFYNVKKERMVYECAARCKCRLGQKSSEIIPTVREDFAEYLAEVNFNKFKEVHPELVTDLVG